VFGQNRCSTRSRCESADKRGRGQRLTGRRIRPVPHLFNVSRTSQIPCVPSPALISFQRLSCVCSSDLCPCWSSPGMLFLLDLSPSGILPRRCLILSLELRFPQMLPPFSRGSVPPVQGSLQCSAVGDDEGCGSGTLGEGDSTRNLAQTMCGLGRAVAAACTISSCPRKAVSDESRHVCTGVRSYSPSSI